MPGYPDWQRIQTRVPLPVLNNPSVSLDGSAKALGTFFVGNTPYLAIIMTVLATGGGMRLRLIWQETPDITSKISVNDYVLPDTNTLTTTVVTRAPWVSVEAFLVDTTTAEANVVVQPTFAPPTHDTPFNPVIIQVFGSTVAAGATDTIESSVTIPGPAQISLSFNATQWVLLLQELGSTGTWIDYAEWNGFSARQFLETRIALPKSAMRVRFSNNDASGHGLHLMITALQ